MLLMANLYKENLPVAGSRTKDPKRPLTLVVKATAIPDSSATET
jgi:hypothetical protein